MNSVHNLLQNAYHILRKANVPSAENDAQLLLAELMGTSKLQLILMQNELVSDSIYIQYQQYIKQRANRKPLQHILGYTYFYGSKIKVNSSVLIPRPETELLCERAIQYIGTKAFAVLDLCTGSGCIAITLAKNCINANITAIDISTEALRLAQENANKEAVNIHFVQNNLMQNLQNVFDVIVSNPPYVKTSDIACLEPEVKQDPVLALDGGTDGLDLITNIIAQCETNLKTDGMLMLEIGHDQSALVKELLQDKFYNIEILQDYCEYNRFVIAYKK